MKKKKVIAVIITFLAVAVVFGGCSLFENKPTAPEKEVSIGDPPRLFSPSSWPQSMSDFKWPVVRNQEVLITAGYSPWGGSSYHRGAEWHAVDLVNGDKPEHTRWMWVVNPARGRVKQIGTNSSDLRGYFVIMDHGNGWESRIYHLQTNPTNFIAVGNDLLQGTFLGYTGSSGYATGPHIHFVILKNGISQPLRGIDGDYDIRRDWTYTSFNVYVRPPFGNP